MIVFQQSQKTCLCVPSMTEYINSHKLYDCKFTVTDANDTTYRHEECHKIVPWYCHVADDMVMCWRGDWCGRWRGTGSMMNLIIIRATPTDWSSSFLFPLFLNIGDLCWKNLLQRIDFSSPFPFYFFSIPNNFSPIPNRKGRHHISLSI